MPKMNFSKEDQEVLDLTRDLIKNDFSAHVDETKVGKKELENYLRNKINNDMLGGLTLYQAFRRNKTTLFEIIEEIVDVTIAEDVMNSPFVDSFVEVKNRRLGDNTAFYSEGGLLSVASFAGNHWDTNRQALDLGEEFVLPREWIFIDVYEELERFLLGIVTLEKITDKIYKSMNKYIQDRIYVQFQNVANSVPTDYSKTGNTEEALGQLVDLIQAKGAYSNITIAGTKGALRKLAAVVPDKMFANSQKEAKAQTGSIGDWEGNTLMVIPQTLKSGKNELALDDTKVFILGADVKPIKLEIIGDTRSDIDTEGKKNNDMSVEVKVQTQIAMGMLLPEAFGMFTFAN